MNLRKQIYIFHFVMLIATQVAFAQVNVVTEYVTNGHMQKLLKFTGETRPFIETYAAADVAGPVAKILIEDGQRVKKNQTLAVIDEIRFEIVLRMNQGKLDHAKRQLFEDQKDFERNKTLFDKSAITQKSFDMAETKVIKAKASLKQVQADYDKAKLDLDRCAIKAPIKGFFVDKAVELGQAMQRGQNVGKVIFLDTVYVEAKIAEKDIRKIKIGQKCLIEDKFPGEIAFINVYADKSRAFKVRIRVDNPDVFFKANMFVRGSILLEDFIDVPVFSSRAIRNDRGKQFVYIVENNKAIKKQIDIVAQKGELTYSKQIKTGMSVVTVGQDNLDNNSEVVLRNIPAEENKN